MRILPKPLKFEWGKGNMDKNQIKHGVINKKAEEVFENRPKFIIKDVKHPLKERRFQLWGKTNRGRKLSIIFTIRAKKIRIISVRDMNKKERKMYAKKEKI
jgi:uncharacterized DUF497 family protein